jgi:WD40 repeat protein
MAIPGDGQVATIDRKFQNQLPESEREAVIRSAQPDFVAGKTNGRRISNGFLTNKPSQVPMESVEEVGTFMGHRGPVRTVIFSGDQNLVVSGGQEGGVRLRSLSARASRDVVLPKVHPGGVHRIALSPDNNLLASVAAGHEDTVYLWDLADSNPKLRSLLRLPQPRAESLAFSPQVHLLAVGCGSSILYWDLNRIGNREGCVLQSHSQAVNCLSFAPNGLLLASGGQDGKVCLWSTDIRNPRHVAEFDTSKGAVLSVAFSADSSFLASGSNDQTIHLWEYRGEKLSHEILQGHGGPVRLVLFPNDGRTLVSVDRSHHAYLWDLASRSKIRQWLLPGGSTITSVACTSDGRYLATGNVGLVTVLNLFAKSKEYAGLAVG